MGLVTPTPDISWSNVIPYFIQDSNDTGKHRPNSELSTKILLEKCSAWWTHVVIDIVTKVVTLCSLSSTVTMRTQMVKASCLYIYIFFKQIYYYIFHKPHFSWTHFSSLPCLSLCVAYGCRPVSCHRQRKTQGVWPWLITATTIVIKGIRNVHQWTKKL